jgi:pimeloyl-ACP methyl ester carboxylesterase
MSFSLIALHGNGGGAHRFSLLHQYLFEDVRFSALTLPGFAGGKPLPSLFAYTSWIREQIRTQPAPRLLLGHGIGGSMALEFVQHFSSDIDGLILHAPVGAHLDTRWFPQLLRPRFMRLAAQQAVANSLLRPLWRRLFFQRPVPAAFQEQFFASYADCPAFPLMFDLITAEWFQGLVPNPIATTLLWGGKERLLSAKHIPAYAPLLPNHTTRIIDHWDHFPMADQPADYAATIVNAGRLLLQPA